MTIISHVNCPRCNSQKLYKFGKDPDGIQKYQCKDCMRQFTQFSTNKPVRDYPRCPLCNKKMYLHHDYKHYSAYSCKPCYHSMKIIKTTAIDKASCELIFGKSNLVGMRFPLHIILSALTLYFLCNVSTRKVSQHFKLINNISVSHVTIASWAKKFAPMFTHIADKFKPSLNLHSDEWHADETVVKINGKKYYLWVLIDAETRFVINFHLSPYRDSEQAFILFNQAKSFGKPYSIVSDRLPSYITPASTCFKNTKHIQVNSFKDDISNNLIESFNDTFKSWYKPKKGFNSFSSCNNLISVFIYFYNFIRPHSSLSGLSPAQVAGASYDDTDKSNWLLTA